MSRIKASESTKNRPQSAAGAQGARLTVDADNSAKPLKDCVTTALELYFEQLDSYEVSDLYALVIEQVEAPLLAVVMDQSKGNQTRASQMLGINRGTLRKKLRQYSLD